MVSKVLQGANISSGRQLYKFLIRECDKLPKGPREYYKHFVKQSFKQHAIEPDAERVQEIMEKSLSDAQWILKKYNKELSGPKKDKTLT